MDEELAVNYGESILYGSYHFLEIFPEFPNYRWLEYLPKTTKLEQLHERLEQYEQEGRKVWITRETCLSTRAYIESFKSDEPSISDQELNRLMES